MTDDEMKLKHDETLSAEHAAQTVYMYLLIVNRISCGLGEMERQKHACHDVHKRIGISSSDTSKGGCSWAQTLVSNMASLHGGTKLLV